MKKKGILLIAVILLSSAGLAQAQEGQLSGTVDFTYLSSYIWRGFDIYGPGGHSAIQLGADVDLYGTGFGLKVLSSRAVGANFENAEGLDFTLYYYNSIFEGETYATDYKVGWVYYGYPDEPKTGTASGQAADMQEFFVSFSLPEICPGGIVPSYTAVSLWPSGGETVVRNNAGWLHILGLGYDLVVPGLLPETPEQTLHLSLEVVYNSGAAPGVVPGPGATGSKIAHDWSHAVFGVSTDFDLGNNLSFTPGIYHQSSWEDSVNTQDETWLSLSMRYIF